jgi:hypothetical protein
MNCDFLETLYPLVDCSQSGFNYFPQVGFLKGQNEQLHWNLGPFKLFKSFRMLGSRLADHLRAQGFRSTYGLDWNLLSFALQSQLFEMLSRH